MVASPSLAIDLPLKALVAEDDGRAKVWVSYNSPEYLQQRHVARPADLIKSIAGAGTLMAKRCGIMQPTEESAWRTI